MDEPRARLAEALRIRAREELGMTWVEVARRAGMTVSNLNLIRKGQINITDLAAAGIEKAVEWERGTINRTLAGELTAEEAAALPRAGGAQAEARRKLRDLVLRIEAKHGPEKALELLQGLATLGENEGDSEERSTGYLGK